jgi:hypothetical protein
VNACCCRRLLMGSAGHENLDRRKLRCGQIV